MLVFITLLEHLFNFVAMLFIVRILLQLARANINNPIAQFINKFTTPIINIIRKFIPDIGKFNLSAFLICLFIIVTKFFAFTLVVESFSLSAKDFAIVSLIGLPLADTSNLSGLIVIFCNLFLILFLALMVMSFIHQGQYHPATDFLRQVTSPILRPLQKIIPPIGGTIDITPMIVLFVLFYLQGFLLNMVPKLLAN